MKLGVSYIVFDGVELLEYSIRQIRKHVDFLQVIYQNKSWFGHPLPKENMIELNRLKKIGLIDELTMFSSFSVLTARNANMSKSFEKRKRQTGLASCLRQKCTHYLCMDVDEFYIEEDFKNAKEEIKINGYTSTAVKYINYVGIPTLHRGSDGMVVPFICMISNKSMMTSHFFKKCDPTRGIQNVGNKKHMFPPNKLIMHHMETIRKDILLKYQSTTRSLINRAKTNELASNIRLVDENTKTFSFNKIIYPKTPEVKLTVTENIFNIPYKEWKK